MLMAINILLILAVSAVLVWIFFYLKSIGTLAARTRREAAQLGMADDKIKGERLPAGVGPGCRILIELVAPIVLAHRESAMAKIVSEIAPNMVTRAVYKQLRKELAQALAERQIDAKITLLIC